MWTRKELKTRAKAAFKPNYWKAVLVALIMTLLIGGGASAGSAGTSSIFSGSAFSNIINNSEAEEETYSYDTDDFDYDIDEAFDYNDIDADIMSRHNSGHDSRVPNTDYEDSYSDYAIGIVATVIMFVAIFALIFLVVLILAFLVQAFLLNPLEIGIDRFFLRNLNEKAEVRELAYAYDHNYLNTVKIMFFKDLFELLWSLLFIIPGIVKAYEYRMIPYLLARNPEMSREEAFARSKEMMRGNKWKAFILDLSFIPWQLLSAITFGIVGMFYVDPYVNQTNAALFDALYTEHYGDRQISGTAPYGNPNPYGTAADPNTFGSNPYAAQNPYNTPNSYNPQAPYNAQDPYYTSNQQNTQNPFYGYSQPVQAEAPRQSYTPNQGPETSQEAAAFRNQSTDLTASEAEKVEATAVEPVNLPGSDSPVRPEEPAVTALESTAAPDESLAVDSKSGTESETENTDTSDADHTIKS